MNRPLEPVTLADPAPRSAAGKVLPAAPVTPVKANAAPGIIHPTAAAPMSFGETFMAVFLAILAAAAVIWLVATVRASMQDSARLRKDIEELHRETQKY